MPPPGPVSLFRNKVRKPVTLTLTAAHHEQVNRAARQLGLSRADTIGLLIHLYADTVQRPAPETVHETRSLFDRYDSLTEANLNQPWGRWPVSIRYLSGKRRSC